MKTTLIALLVASGMCSAAAPLEIVGYEAGGKLTFQGGTIGNYFTVEYACSPSGPWTNWGSLSSQPITGQVMVAAGPMFFRISSAEQGPFPPYALTDHTHSLVPAAVTADLLDGLHASELIALAGDITSVVAGSGLTGGGTEGSVTVNIGTGTGLISSDDTVSLDMVFSDSRYVNEGQTLSVSAGMIQGNTIGTANIINGTILAEDLSFTPLTNPYTGNLNVIGAIDASADISAGDDLNAADDLNVNDDAYIGSSGSAGKLYVRNSSAATTVELASVWNSGGAVVCRGDDGRNGVVIDADTGSGGNISVLNMGNPNYTRIQLIGDKGDGTGQVRVNGTAVHDYAEFFPLSDQEEIEPGMVVVIDPTSPGFLRRSYESYDKKVAGIVAGAGGFSSAMVIGDETDTNRNKPIAVSGRVYCLVDASSAPIEIGDPLTTSDMPGYAMKATELDRSRGATIGKAMTALNESKGLVLVLVSLQ